MLPAGLLALAVALALARRPLAVWRAERALPRGTSPTVLLVTLDAVRADRPGFAGGPVPTPGLDALAGTGVVFENAYVQSPLGAPSHATILTGLMPGKHGLRDDQDDRLSEDAPLLADAFRQAGYGTAALVSSSLLERSRGFARGFDFYHDDFGAAGKDSVAAGPAPAAETVFRALNWVASHPDRPLFLWIHLADALPPHRPPEPFATSFRDRPYDGEIALLDQEITRLVDGVRAARPRTLVAVVGAHGESLGDHGEPWHGLFVYGSTTHVPFILSMPGHLPQGRTIRGLVRAMDLSPTLLDLCGLPGPARSDGASLVPLIVGRTGEGPGPVPIENDSLDRKYGFSPIAALRSGPYLYVRSPQPELYDVVQDPAEKENAAARLPDVVKRLEAELVKRVPAPATSTPLPDPKDRLDVFTRYVAASALEAAGQTARAEVAYRSVLSEEPRFVLARRRLGECLTRQGRAWEAAVVFQETIDRGEADETTYLNLALTQFREGSLEKAAAVLLRGVDAQPRSARLQHRTGRMLLKLGRTAEAERHLRQAIAEEPLFADAYVALGAALEAQGKGAEARSEYERVVAMAPLLDEAKEARAALDRLAANR